MGCVNEHRKVSVNTKNKFYFFLTKFFIFCSLCQFFQFCRYYLVFLDFFLTKFFVFFIKTKRCLLIFLLSSLSFTLSLSVNVKSLLFIRIFLWTVNYELLKYSYEQWTIDSDVWTDYCEQWTIDSICVTINLLFIRGRSKVTINSSLIIRTKSSYERKEQFFGSYVRWTIDSDTVTILYIG